MARTRRPLPQDDAQLEALHARVTDELIRAAAGGAPVKDLRALGSYAQRIERTLMRRRRDVDPTPNIERRLFLAAQRDPLKRGIG
jgi:hypothetical protein